MTSELGAPRSQLALAYLRQKITSGEWPVNSRIPTEPELMELIGVGRGTVREAVRSLANLGMLETLVSRGTYVRSRLPVSNVIAEFISGFDVTDILGFRRALEVEAAQQAALHHTDDQLAELRAAVHVGDVSGRVEHGLLPGQFHHLLVECAGNRLASGLYLGVMAGLRRAVDSGAVVHGSSPEERHADHEAILAAVEARDPVAAAQAMVLHAERDLVLPA